MKSTMKIATAISAVLVSSTALGVTGMDRLVFSPGFMFEKGNYAELTLATAEPTVSPTAAPDANLVGNVDTVRLSYKRQLTDKLGLGLMVNTQPIGVDIDYQKLGSSLKGSVSAESYIALGHYKATENVSAFGGIKHQRTMGSADLTAMNPNLPGVTTFKKDLDTGFIVGAAYSKPEIALRASLSYESALSFDHDTTYNHPTSGNEVSLGTTTSETPETATLELQSGIAKDTLLFGSVRKTRWSNAQITFLSDTQLSSFVDKMDYKLGVGRKFSDSISGSITLNYEPSTGQPSSPFSPQDGEKGIALGGKFTAKDGLMTSIGIQYRSLGDTVTSTGTKFSDNNVVTVGLKLAKSF